MNAGREGELVELVSPDGTPIGSATVAQAHTAPGQLHRAFSVLLFDEAGQTLLQQRAATKTRFPLRWANACCGHPAPGEPVITAAARRLREELGVFELDLAEGGVYVYAAADPATGRVEREYDHVVVGHVVGEFDPSPDPDEVAQTRWVQPRDMLGDNEPFTSSDYAPWLLGVLRVATSSPLLRKME